jgi:Na+/H+ antiporter NhaA
MARKKSNPSLYLFPRKNLDFAGGITMIITTIVALIIANSPIASDFHHILREKIEIGFQDGLLMELSIEEWINDGLMVIFFFVIGLEIKRELAVGELSSVKKASLPLIAAIGGMRHFRASWKKGTGFSKAVFNGAGHFR